ncbi:hypothetical protein [Streptomyces yangpuensis]
MTSGYPPLPEPFSEALGEAAHTAAMAYRLVLAISDAVRRAAQKRLTGREEELGEDAGKMALGWSADQLRGHLGDDILAVLMQDADWPRMARQLVGLQQAGVDLGTFLPQMGRMTAGVHQAVTANAAPTAAPAAAAPAPAPAAGARVPADDPWAPPPRPIPAPAPAASAPAPGAAVGAARDVLAERMGAAGDPWAAPARPVPAQSPLRHPPPPPPPAPVPASSDAKRAWGPLTEGLTVPRDLGLDNRPRALKRLKV